MRYLADEHHGVRYGCGCMRFAAVYFEPTGNIEAVQK